MNHLHGFKQEVDARRAAIDSMGTLVRKMIYHPVFEGGINPHNMDFGEAKANLMLAFRKLEDARMRLGKALQAMDGGVSVYDKLPKPQLGDPPGTTSSIGVGHPCQS